MKPYCKMSYVAGKNKIFVESSDSVALQNTNSGG